MTEDTPGGTDGAPEAAPRSVAAGPSTFRLGALDVMAADLDIMSWDDAMTAAAALGSGWRLPDVEELKGLYAARAAIGGFSLVDRPYYWSSEHHGVVLSDGGDDGSRWYLTFDRGEAYTDLHTGTMRARAVRDAT